MVEHIDEVSRKRDQIMRGLELKAHSGQRLKGGGPPTDNGDMEARVAALEEAVKNLPTKADLDTRRRETKAEWSEFTNASKAEFAALRADIAKSQADMHKAIADNHRWTHGALIGIGTIAVAGIIGVISTIWTAGKPPPQSVPSSPQQPIIINVPSPGATPKP